MIDGLLASAAARRAADAVAPSVPADEVLARVAWNVVAEPGDGVAGALIAEMGAVEALRATIGDRGSPLTGGASARALHEGLARWRPRASVESAIDALTSAARIGAELLVPGDVRWPRSVDDLGLHAPIVLWARGDAALLSARSRIAIVGARASSSYGDLLAAEYAGDLAADGTVIVSGGAYGIDGAAHRAALAVGGPTAALLAGGVDRAYPRGHESLLRTIAERGVVASEVPCDTSPTKWRFLSRNRLIAALGDATVVVEAGWRSGSLNTAGHAAALGRPLGAVPGPVTSASSAGCHRLLREYDAHCVTTTAEIRELCGGTTDVTPQAPPDPEQTRLCDALSTRTPLRPQELARRSGLSPERVVALLGLLELDGGVIRTDSGWRRAPAAGR